MLYRRDVYAFVAQRPFGTVGLFYHACPPLCRKRSSGITFALSVPKSRLHAVVAIVSVDSSLEEEPQLDHRQTAELAALVSAHSVHLIEGTWRIPDAPLQNYWTNCRLRLYGWMRVLNPTTEDPSRP